MTIFRPPMRLNWARQYVAGDTERNISFPVNM
jgi:hypothetical protein